MPPRRRRSGGCRECLSRCRHRISRCLECKVCGCRLILSDSFVSMWVRRWVVVTWAIFEAIMSLVLTLPFLVASEVASAGWILTHWLILVCILLFRFTSALLGAFSGCYRKVFRMKLYFGLMVANLLMSIFVALPAYNCQCICRNPYFGDAQCNILNQIHRVVGPASDDPLPGQALHRSRTSIPRLLPPAHFQGRSSMPDVASRSSRLALTAKASAFAGFDDPRDTSDGIDKLLALYFVTDVGIGWQANRTINCSSYRHTDLNDGIDLRNLLMQIQCGQGEFNESSGRRLAPLKEHLRKCSTDWECKVIAIYNHVDLDSSSSSYDICRFGMSTTPMLNVSELNLDLCMCPERCIQPELRKQSSCANCTSMTTYLKAKLHLKYHSLMNKTEMHTAQWLCRLTMSYIASIVILVDSVALLMLVIVFRFMQNHCGDEFSSEDQFAVRSSFTTSGFDDDDEDFLEVSSGRRSRGSAAANGSLQDRQSTYGSGNTQLERPTASVEMSQM